MKAIILAAGVGRRLSEVTHSPKSLLAFNGRSLMQRHIDNLAALGIKQICLCLGYEHKKILAHISSPSAVEVSYEFNPDFREGSMISLWSMREDFADEDDVVLMDADVLYERSILERLTLSNHRDLALIDQDFADGDEPVKICLRDGRIVEFRKKVAADLDFETIGESVGFFRFSPMMSKALIERATQYIEKGDREAPCEEAIRDVLLAHSARFIAEDITGLRWIEIDFPEDVKRAEIEILPFVDN